MSSPFEIFRMPFTIYQQIPGAYVDGIWVNGGENALQITASLQPSSGEEMLSLPEGRRNRKTYTLFTSTKINVLHNAANCDQIEILGERYEIVNVDIWQNNPAIFGVVNHYKFIAVAIEAIP